MRVCRGKSSDYDEQKGHSDDDNDNLEMLVWAFIWQSVYVKQEI